MTTIFGKVAGACRRVFTPGREGIRFKFELNGSNLELFLADLARGGNRLEHFFGEMAAQQPAEIPRLGAYLYSRLPELYRRIEPFLVEHYQPARIRLFSPAYEREIKAFDPRTQLRILCKLAAAGDASAIRALENSGADPASRLLELYAGSLSPNKPLLQAIVRNVAAVRDFGFARFRNDGNIVALFAAISASKGMDNVQIFSVLTRACGQLKLLGIRAETRSRYQTIKRQIIENDPLLGEHLPEIGNDPFSGGTGPRSTSTGPAPRAAAAPAARAVRPEFKEVEKQIHEIEHRLFIAHRLRVKGFGPLKVNEAKRILDIPLQQTLVGEEGQRIVKRAFMKVLSWVHPDKLGADSTPQKEKAKTNLSQLVSMAYQTLSEEIRLRQAA